MHVIDAATNKVVEEIKGIEIPSGVDFSKDGKTLYFSCEGEKTSIRRKDYRQGAADGPPE